MPAGPVRSSARLQGSASATTVMQRAQDITAARNDIDRAGTSGFRVLHKLSDSHLEEVVHDSGLAFSMAGGSGTEILSLIRAKEEAQAALALASIRRSQQATDEAGTNGAAAPVPATEESTPAGDESLDVPRPATSQANKRGSRSKVLASRRGRRPAKGDQ